MKLVSLENSNFFLLGRKLFRFFNGPSIVLSFLERSSNGLQTWFIMKLLTKWLKQVPCFLILAIYTKKKVGELAGEARSVEFLKHINYKKYENKVIIP